MLKESDFLGYDDQGSYGSPGSHYHEAAAGVRKIKRGFDRFWHPRLQYCYDVLDGPTAFDDSLLPNQIFAVSLPESPLSAETTPDDSKLALMVQNMAGFGRRTGEGASLAREDLSARFDYFA